MGHGKPVVYLDIDEGNMSLYILISSPYGFKYNILILINVT